MRFLIHIIIIFLFVGVYCLSEFVNNKILYIGIGREWNEVGKNDKIPLQILIFCLVLPLVLILTDYVNCLIKKDKLVIRIILPVLSMAIIYFVNGYIYKTWGLKDYINMYFHHRRSPAPMWFIMNSFLVIAGLAILEITKSLKIRIVVDDLLRSVIVKK